MFAQLMLKVREDIWGATLIEYGLVAALIALTVIGSIAATGSPVEIMFNSVENAFPAAS